MAMPPSSSLFSRKRRRCSLPAFSVFLLSLFSLFIFIYRNHGPRIFIYRDLASQTPIPRLSLPRSAEFVQEFNDLKESVSSVPDPLDNIDENSVTSSSEPSVPEFQEDNNEEHIAQNVTGNPISSDPDSKDDLGEVTSEPIEEEDVPVSSEPDLDVVKQVEDVTSSDTVKNEAAFNDGIGEKLRNCDFYQGSWVKDENYPVYGPGSCPYVDEGFDCQNNGRPDSEYLNWRWKPNGCDLPRFNATDFLVRLRGKKLMLVGDSMNRNQFESLLCLLREGLTNKTKMYEVHGYKISKGRGYFVFKFEDYDCTVEFVRSHFLVREGVRVNAQGNSNPTLSIDRIDKSARRWQRADILVFNTGHWWTHGKTSRGKNYYKEGNVLYPHFDAVEAYRKAIRTWANWTKRNLKGKLVFYRGYSSAHFRGGDWDSGGSCRGETDPVKSGAIIDSYPEKMTIVEDVFRETRVPAVLLNVTHLTNYRKDGHPSLYGRNVSGGGRRVSSRRQDCSHWCLPGVPDAWNELIYATLVARQT